MDNYLTFDVVCFSHLRWGFVHQRPQHLLGRFAEKSRIFFVEEPIFIEGPDKIELTLPQSNVWVVTPHLQASAAGCPIKRQQALLTTLFRQQTIINYLFWYYTPQALAISEIFHPRLIVYDCMDELSAFKFAPAELKQQEKELISRADIIFTGGKSLYEAKKDLHEDVHCFPSSIDKSHFKKARLFQQDPIDQASIPYPRIGFYGVVDERFDIELLRQTADARPQWHFVIIGPVVKIDPATLPQSANIHYLGSKSYEELPVYLSGWDIATCLFARNESTKFISPTKTPEYLAGGKPVISTSIKDVVDTYGINKLAHIADTAPDFIACAEKELASKDKTLWLSQVDAFLLDNSWDNTCADMLNLIHRKLATKNVFARKSKSLIQPLFENLSKNIAVL